MIPLQIPIKNNPAIKTLTGMRRTGAAWTPEAEADS
jgi:hypothetical protein